MPTSQFDSERATLLRQTFAALSAVMGEAGLRREFDSILDRGDPAPGGGAKDPLPLSFGNYLQTLQLVSAKFPVPALGLRLGAKKSTRALGIFGIGMVTSSDLAQGFRFVPMLLRMLWNQKVQVALHQRSGRAVIKFETAWPRSSAMASLVVEELFMSTTRILAELLPKADWSACAIHLRGPAPAQADLYQEFFPCPIRFMQAADELHLPASWLGRPMALANPTVTTYCATVCRDLAEEEAEVLQARRRVRAYLSGMEASHYPTLQEMAALMQVSERNLRKGLAREATSFRDIVQGYKVELAQKYLTETRLPIKEIAFRLGFAQVPSFYRAFGRIHARTPDQFRMDKGA